MSELTNGPKPTIKEIALIVALTVIGFASFGYFGITYLNSGRISYLAMAIAALALVPNMIYFHTRLFTR